MARYSKAIEGQTVQQQIALLTILIGCGEKAVEAFHAADNPLDETFVEDLERIVERSRQELAVLIAARDADGS